MRASLLIAVGTAAAVGYGVARVRPAVVIDEHAGHADHGATGTGASAPAAPQGSPQGAALPASRSAAAERIASSPRHGEWVVVRTGPSDSVMTWLVYPERRDNAPVVVVIHENRGLTTWVRGVADQLAAEGFIAIAPDLITMERRDDLTHELPPDSGGAAIRVLTNEWVLRALDAVGKHAMALPGARQTYGVVGFCWGGARSFLHATHSPTLGAAVVYYGSPPTADQMAAIRAPVLGLYGGNDARINATIPATDSTMRRLGKSYEYHIFDGAGHGFLGNQDGNPANRAASQAAWPMTVAFLKAKLGG
ncbi:MAG TPA: dienelactone hydrolase family protein [Gemmatimonadaceae bacterium]|nr:dienelactone hydrolase family protein [Gemmatimonadaceae bacterium]